MGFIIGLSAGLFGGLVGLGGGALMIPMMVGWLNLNQHKAHGTSLVALIFTGLVGAGVYACHGRVDMVAALLLAAAALWPARLGARCCHLLPEMRLKRSFGLFQIVMAILLMMKPYLSSVTVSTTGWVKVVVLLATGVVTGFLGGLLGVGGGAIMVASMVLLAGYPQHIAQGSSLLAMIPAGVVGAYTHRRLGNVDGPLLRGLIPGIVLGSLSGGALAQFLPEMALRSVFAAVLIWLGLRLVIQKKPPVCE